SMDGSRGLRPFPSSAAPVIRRAGPARLNPIQQTRMRDAVACRGSTAGVARLHSSGWGAGERIVQ
ncbi:MAG: hypothetical protein KFH98_13910, partial [Gemmatimonadetes bacterium]|nr:hypothetical protein [Gemmatimonadota bacterium]